jgi:hypothetical protein
VSLRFASLLLVVVMLASGCGDGNGSSGSAEVPFAEVVEGLCAMERVLPGDTDEADRIFTDRVHDELHGLADEASSEDRAAAADLLEAKQKVESDLAHGSDGPTLVEDVGHLKHRTIAAVEALGDGTPSCDGPE